jgi:hypothetical protein
LTFACLGFGVITFTAKDLRDPRKQLPGAMFGALGIATVIYVAVPLGVFGTLTVHEVIGQEPPRWRSPLNHAGRGVLAHEHRAFRHGRRDERGPVSRGLCEHMASIGQFPPGSDEPSAIAP